MYHKKINPGGDGKDAWNVVILEGSPAGARRINHE